MYLSSTVDLAIKHSVKYTPGAACCIFACTALTGQWTEGKPGLVQPPEKNKRTMARYNSTVDKMLNPEKIAVYVDWQVLPRYLIIFH